MRVCLTYFEGNFSNTCRYLLKRFGEVAGEDIREDEHGDFFADVDDEQAPVLYEEIRSQNKRLGSTVFMLCCQKDRNIDAEQNVMSAE